MLNRFRIFATNLIRKPRILMVIAILVMALIIIGAGWYWWTSRISQPHLSGENPKEEVLKLTPGRSSHQEIVKVMGTPAEVFEEGEYSVYKYPSSTSYYSPDLLYLKDDTLQMQQLHYTPDQYPYKVQTLQQEQGVPEATLYLPASLIGNRYILVYPRKGLAAFVLSSREMIYQIQRFTPTSLENYRKQWAKDATEALPTPVPVQSDHKP